jgi:hypothetical protein
VRRPSSKGTPAAIAPRLSAPALSRLAAPLLLLCVACCPSLTARFDAAVLSVTVSGLKAAEKSPEKRPSEAEADDDEPSKKKLKSPE